jgi:hypothetical protein
MRARVADAVSRGARGADRQAARPSGTTFEVSQGNVSIDCHKDNLQEPVKERLLALMRDLFTFSVKVKSFIKV